MLCPLCLLWMEGLVSTLGVCACCTAVALLGGRKPHMSLSTRQGQLLRRSCSPASAATAGLRLQPRPRHRGYPQGLHAGQASASEEHVAFAALLLRRQSHQQR